MDDDAAWTGRRARSERVARPSSDRLELPDAARLAVWFSAWCAGRASLDDARDAVVGGDAAHDVIGVPGHAEEPVPLILALGALRAERASTAGLALPVPGDPLGLGGPGSFNVEAIEHEEAVVLDVDLGLVPVRAGGGVVWRCLPAHARRPVPDLPEAETLLRRALSMTADALVDLDVARWRPEVADELMALRRPRDVRVPAGTDGRVLRMLTLALRCRHIVDLALDDDGGARTSLEAEGRRAALAPLERAARRALVAACSVPVDG